MLRIIFTTGSTGSPKPALLSHRNITCRSMCISQAFFGGDSVLLEAGGIPLNRAAKADYVRLHEMAKSEIEVLRAKGKWDCV